MVQKIDGRALAEKIKDEVAKTISQIEGPRPNLAIILIGDREDSTLYVSLKEREGRKVGIDTHLYKLDANVTEAEVLTVIDFLNKDELIDGILIQLPLPSHLNTNRIIAAIDPTKDVDGFHPQHPAEIISPVISSVSACLQASKLSGAGRRAVLLYHSDIFGSGLRQMLEKDGWQILEPSETKQADLLISALGKPESIKQSMIKDGAALIDIGITKVDGRILGDVDFEDIKDKAGYVTPVPGGIGPMTIAFLFKNVLAVYQRRLLK